jgi:hypothetical protein
LPEWCSCEVKGTGHPDNNTLHQHHIQKCLWREASEIKAFKDKMLTAIREGKEKFNNHKSSTIQQIIKSATNQGITETELNNIRPN